jgi:hypothetical protein
MDGLDTQGKDDWTVEGDEAARLPFGQYNQRLNVADVVVIHECGSRIAMIPVYARAPRCSTHPLKKPLSKLKTTLRRARPQSIPAPIRAMRQAINAISSQDARGWFSHAGFSIQSTSQSL